MNADSPEASRTGHENDEPRPPASNLDPPPRRSARTRVLVWIVILFGFAVLFWAILRHRQAQKVTTGRHAAVGTVSVTAVTAKKGNIGVYLDSIGTVTPVYTDAITSQVTGMVSIVHYREGQLVRRGEPLIDIDARPFQAQLLQAQGALERDQNLLAQAKMDLARYQAAWKKNAIARQVLDDQQKLVLQYEGTVKVDQGAVQYDQVQVGFCHIVAPISGRVGLRLIDPGNVVQANSTTPMAVITQLQPITVVFTVAEDSIPQIVDPMRKGKTLAVTAYDRNNMAQIDTGRLQTIDNQIDTTTGTVKLRAIFPNRSGSLFPNLFVNTKLLVKTLDGVTLIPTSAIQQNGDTSFVYVIQNGIAHIRDIKPGVADSGVTQVTGINPGDVIANSSFQKLQDGSKVAIVKNPPASSAAGNNAP